MISLKQTVLTILIVLVYFTGLFASPERSGTLEGVVLDASTNEPVAHVYLHLDEINRSATTDRNGNFRISSIPGGQYSLSLHRIGYQNRSISVTIEPDQENEIEIILFQRVIRGEDVEVVADAQEVTGAHLHDASIKVTGDELRRNLGATISETLSRKPGFAQRSMGAATTRPVIRGLGDERVLILRDGERTGDVSSTSADHSVSIDPISTNEIEVARGPSALAYGSNAIGGVVNVVRNQIPTSVPSSLSGTATLQGSSVNSGLSGAGQLFIPHNDYVFTVDLNGRLGNDYRSPEGRIDNSGYATTNSSAGVSYIRPWGYSGLSVSTYLSDYGIPPDPDGGHPNGVDIEMRQIQIDNKNEFLIRNSFLRLLEVSASYRYYNHKEFETAEIIGTEYITNTGNIKVNARHHDLGFFKNGRFGFEGEIRDYIVIDRANIETTSFSGALYAIQEADAGRFHFEFGTRFELQHVLPREERFSQLIGQIERRTFAGLATSVSAVYNLGNGWNIGSVLMHSYRPPSSEELFSQGPHIAAYTFEIGNPELNPERGLGTELFLSYSGSAINATLTGYHNYFSNYIYPRDTGRESVPFPNLNEFQYEAVKAEISGFEFESELSLTSRLTANLTASYTQGTREISDEEKEDTGIEDDHGPLPMIPPFSSSAGLNYTFGAVTLGSNVRYSAKQNRISQFETPTDDYILVDLNAQYRFTSANNLLHTFSFGVQNLLNQEYRNHLSRLKDIFPEPGINFNLLYRVYF